RHHSDRQGGAVVTSRACMTPGRLQGGTTRASLTGSQVNHSRIRRLPTVAPFDELVWQLQERKRQLQALDGRAEPQTMRRLRDLDEQNEGRLLTGTDKDAWNTLLDQEDRMANLRQAVKNTRGREMAPGQGGTSARRGGARMPLDGDIAQRL